jgi:hypothetical protein
MSMFGLGGGYGQGSEESEGSYSKDLWTPQQKKTAKGFYQNYLRDRIGQGMPGYEGELTAGPSDIQNTLFSDVKSGTGAFGAWANLAKGPEEWNRRVAERSATEQGLLAPERAKEDALLKSKMASMGLSSSSDVLKAGMDLSNKRELQDTQFRQQLYDQYEQLGLQVTPQVISAISDIGNTQREIEQQGLTAKYQEWLRQQPEYSPVIAQLLQFLGLRGAESGTSEASGSSTSWGVTGEGETGEGRTVLPV